MLNPAILEVGSLFLIVCSAVLLWLNPFPLDGGDAVLRIIQSVLPASCCAISYYYNDLYDLRVVRNWGEYCTRLLRAVAIACILLVTFYTIFPATRLSGDPLVSTVGILCLLIGVSLPLRLGLYAVIEKRFTAKRVIIVGANPLAKEIIEAIEAERHFRYHIVGVTDGSLTAEDAGGPLLRYPFVTPLSQLPRLVEETAPDRIIVARSETAEDLPIEALLELRGRRMVIEDGLEAYERMTGKLPIEFVPAASIIFSTDFRKPYWRLAFTRVLSVIVAGVALALTWPLFALIALLIKLDSRGTVFFTQRRISLYGRPFTLAKFRTMHPVKAGSVWTGNDDDRITRVGRWLRKYRLDELPQLLNILKGDMNLIGPRPYPVQNRQVLTENIPYYAIRSMIRPGLTGWAQVRNGYASGLEEEREKMCYDLYYLKHLSPWLDLQILADTVKIVLLGDAHRATDSVRSAQHRTSGASANGAAKPERREPALVLVANAAGPAPAFEAAAGGATPKESCWVDPEITLESRRLFQRN